MQTLTTRMFKNDNSQAVRIPQELRLETTQVEISRAANGDLIIHPIPTNRGATLLEALNAFDTDFIDALTDNQQDQANIQDREPL